MHYILQCTACVHVTEIVIWRNCFLKFLLKTIGTVVYFYSCSFLSQNGIVVTPNFLSALKGLQTLQRGAVALMKSV